MELSLEEPTILLEPETDNEIKTKESKVDEEIIKGIISDYYLLFGKE